MLSIALFTPTWNGQLGKDDDLGSRVTNYSHKIAAVGGFWEAEFSLPVSLAKGLEYWRDALGWYVEVRNPGGSLLWEGFINHIEVSVGVISLERGPMMDIVNRAWLKYQTVSYNTNPPIGGKPATTAVVNDTVSQEKYGILQGFLTGGEATGAQADQAVAIYIAENKDPRGNIPGLTPSENENDNPAVITFSCLGFVHLLTKYYYSNTTATGMINLSDKVIDILAADPSGRFSPNAKFIEANTTQVGDYSDGQKNAWQEIQELLDLGDSSNRRWLFQILGGRIAYLFPIPDEIFYLFSLADPAQKIRLAQEVEVYRWDVKAARWLVVTELMSEEETDLRLDPSAVFVESAEYTMPWHVAIAGGQANTLPQILRRMGI